MTDVYSFFLACLWQLVVVITTVAKYYGGALRAHLIPLEA